MNKVKLTITISKEAFDILSQIEQNENRTTSNTIDTAIKFYQTKNYREERHLRKQV